MLLLQEPTEELIFGLIKSGKLIELLFDGVFTIISILGAAYLAYRYAIVRLRRETPLLIQRDLYNKKLNALQEIWKLLQYTTKNENSKSILLWDKDKKTKNITWSVVKENGKKFLNEIEDNFYGAGNGIFIGKELKELLFEYRGILYGILLKEQDNNESKIQVKKNEVAERLVKIHDNLVALLKQKIKELPDDVRNEKD